MTTYDLKTIAGVLKLTPRTVARKLGCGVSVTTLCSSESVLFAYNLSLRNLKQCVNGNDELMTSAELSRLLDIPQKLVQSRSYPVAAYSERMVRYLKSAAMQRHVEQYSGKLARKRIE